MSFALQIISVCPFLGLCVCFCCFFLLQNSIIFLWSLVTVIITRPRHCAKFVATMAFKEPHASQVTTITIDVAVHVFKVTFDKGGSWLAQSLAGVCASNFQRHPRQSTVIRLNLYWIEVCLIQRGVQSVIVAILSWADDRKRPGVLSELSLHQYESLKKYG